MKNGWTCQKHQDSPIVLVCTGNAWHFQGLCTNCVPDHTKNHPKHIKIQLQGIKEVMQKATDIKKKVSHICEQRLVQSQAMIKEEQFSYLKTLNEKREILIAEINKLFDGLIEQSKKKRSQEQKNQRQSLNKLIASLEQSIKFFKKDDYTDINQFCRQIKKYYFKQNLDVYVEEYDEIIRQYRQKVIQYNPFVWVKDFQSKVRLFLKQCFKVQNQVQKKQKIEKQEKEPKKQLKRKDPGRKKCGKCGNQMQYLTEWKKHLVCRVCGGKERNYVKK